MVGVQVNVHRTTLQNTVIYEVLASHIGNEESLVQRSPADTQYGVTVFTVDEVAFYEHLQKVEG